MGVTAAEISPALAADETFYSGFGLAIAADFPIPGLTPEARGGECDVRMRARKVGIAFESESEPGFRFSANERLFYWPRVAAFAIRGPNRIDVEPSVHEERALLHLPLLGAVFAAMLDLRGALVLHASALVVAGQAVLFLGDKGAGKSTTAAALLAAGHDLLTDDVAALQLHKTHALAMPGYPEIKLNDDSAARVALREDEIVRRPHPAFPKRQRRLAGQFRRTPCAVTRIYVLDRRSESLAIAGMAAPKALSAIIGNAYMARFRTQLTPAAQAALMRDCAALAGIASVRRLSLPRDGLGRLPEIAAFIERDLEERRG